LDASIGDFNQSLMIASLEPDSPSESVSMTSKLDGVR